MVSTLPLVAGRLTRCSLRYRSGRPASTAAATGVRRRETSVSQHTEKTIQAVREVVKKAAGDPNLVRQRHELAEITADAFAEIGRILHVGGHLIGPDRTKKQSPFAHGSDETVAISLLLRIASKLVSASSDLFANDNQYAAAALLRQLVEIEYLAWAFETRDKDGERWLRSTKSERHSFFSPAKIRKAAEGKFRGIDYSYHCELGGHPVPGSSALLAESESTSQLLMSDLLGHAAQIWNHVASWARANGYGELLFAHNQELAGRYTRWKKNDPLVGLPPP